MATRALTVAVIAGVLLVVVVVADAAMSRTYHLEAQVEGRWVLIASAPPEYGRYAQPGLVAFEVNASDAVPLRLRVDNGLPWAASETFEVTLHGRALHEGVVTAPARGTGITEFSVPAASLFAPAYEEPRPAGPGEPRTHAAWFEARVAGEALYGQMAFREVSR